MSKASLWAPDGTLVARRTRPNPRVEGPGYPALDARGIEVWLEEALRELALLAPVTDLVPVAHGAGVAVLRGGALALPPMDYELDLSPEERASYLAQRPPFSRTGSPALPLGLNLGAQLHALEYRHPGLLGPDATLLPWAQYWAWRLCGVAASEVTSLGCHTDLWCPATATFSALAVARGWAERFAPIRSAADVLGTLTPDWSARTGLPTTVRIHTGLHDSNAALLAVRASLAADGEVNGGVESTVLSTGTWFVMLRTPDAPVDLATLPEARDCLVNVDVRGYPIPSARFMGGREIELLTGDDPRLDVANDSSALLAALPQALCAGALPCPTQAPGCGPYPHGTGQWPNRPGEANARRAAIAVYAALMADAALDLIGSTERLVVEGRFAAVEGFVRTLASLRPQQAVMRAATENDASWGALCLLNPAPRPAAALQRVPPFAESLVTPLREARTVWRRAAEAAEHVESER